MTPTKIVCFGSSLTETRAWAELDKWPTRLHLLLEQERPGEYEVYNRGVGGNTTAMGLERIATDIFPFLPAWVIIGFGGNDSNVRPYRKTPRLGLADFEINLEEICRLVKERGGRPILLNYHLPKQGEGEARDNYLQGNGKTHAENLLPYQEAARRVAEKECAPLISIPNLMEAAGVTTADIVIPDGIHLNKKGSHFYGDQIARFLLPILHSL